MERFLNFRRVLTKTFWKEFQRSSWTVLWKLWHKGLCTKLSMVLAPIGASMFVLACYTQVLGLIFISHEARDRITGQFLDMGSIFVLALFANEILALCSGEFKR